MYSGSMRSSSWRSRLRFDSLPVRVSAPLRFIPLCGKRNSQRESRASARFALDLDPPAMCLRGPLRDVQAQPHTTGVSAPAGIHAVKPVEYPRKVLRGNALARIRYRQERRLPVVAGLQRYRDRATRGRILDRIVQQIRRDLPQPERVADDLRLLDLRDGKIDALAPRQRLELLVYLQRQLVQRDRLSPKLNLLRVGARQQQQVLHDGRHAARLVDDAPKDSAILVRRTLAH